MSEFKPPSVCRLSLYTIYGRYDEDTWRQRSHLFMLPPRWERVITYTVEANYKRPRIVELDKSLLWDEEAAKGKLEEALGGKFEDFTIWSFRTASHEVPIIPHTRDSDTPRVVRFNPCDHEDGIVSWDDIHAAWRCWVRWNKVWILHTQHTIACLTLNGLSPTVLPQFTQL